MHPRNTGHKTASVVGWGGGGEGRQAGADGGRGRGRGGRQGQMGGGGGGAASAFCIRSTLIPPCLTDQRNFITVLIVTGEPEQTTLLL